MEEKDLYREKFQAKLKEMKARLNLLESKAAQVKAESKLEYQRQIDDLKRKRQVLSDKLDEIKKSSGEAWKDLKGGAEKAAEELRAALDRAMDKFK